jgi:peptidoglycan hydrolase CwlO-like protein
MKNLELRSSLIKSGALLALCIFFIYAFAVGDSGGIGGTIGSLISGITFLIGLTIALVISVLILFGIYFGILYLYNPEVSKKTYDELKAISTAATAKLPISAKCCHSKKAAASTPVVSVEDLQTIETNQSKLGAQLKNIGSTVETLQESLDDFSTTLHSVKDGMTTLEEKTSSFEEALELKATTEAVGDSSKKLNSELESIKGSLKPLTEKLSTLEEKIASLSSQDDENGNIQSIIDKAVDGLKDDINAVQNDLTTLKAAPVVNDKDKATNKDEGSTHRILAYFTKKADEKKFVTSVKNAVDQGMTYAQIDEFLVDALSKEAGVIIADHPSLTKDYIRTIRQKD